MNEEERNTELFDLAVKKFSGEASEAELKRLEEIIAYKQIHQETFDALEGTWHKTEAARGITSDDVEREWKKLDSVIKENKHAQNTAPMLKWAAAILLVLASTVIFFLVNNNSTTQIIANEISKENLIDGSLITLNAGAAITYNKQFNKKNREIWLTGEAFFEVRKDPDKPFIVHAGDISVTVVGTSFNILTNSANNTSEVLVNSGIVEVHHGATKLRLRKGDIGILNKSTGKFSSRSNGDINLLAWKTRKLIFEETPLSVALTHINNVYSDSVYVKNEGLKECPVTVTFDQMSFDAVIKILASTLNLEVVENPQVILLSGEGCD